MFVPNNVHLEFCQNNKQVAFNFQDYPREDKSSCYIHTQQIITMPFKYNKLKNYKSVEDIGANSNPFKSNCNCVIHASTKCSAQHCKVEAIRGPSVSCHISTQGALNQDFSLERYVPTSSKNPSLSTTTSSHHLLNKSAFSFSRNNFDKVSRHANVVQDITHGERIHFENLLPISKAPFNYRFSPFQFGVETFVDEEKNPEGSWYEFKSPRLEQR